VTQVQFDNIVEKALALFEIGKPYEYPLVTFWKAHNKFIFDKNWYDDVLRMEDEHYK